MYTMGFMGLPGGPEVLLVLLILLLLFGAKRLPELSRSLGKSLGEFKKGKEELEREIDKVKNDVIESEIIMEDEDDAGDSKEAKPPSSEA